MTDRSITRTLRIGLATVVALDLVAYFFFVADARARAPSTDWNWLVGAVSSMPGRSLLMVVGIVGAVSFGMRPGRLRSGAVALGALVLLSTAHTQLFGSPWRHMFFSGLTLLGWLAGLALARSREQPEDEVFAATGSRALLGAAYFSASISKVLYGGLAWIDGTSIQASVVNQTGMVADTWLNGYRVWAAHSPGIAVAFAVATIVVEGLGIGMLGGRRLRAVAALGLVGMHFNIFLLTGIMYGESMFLLVLFGWPFRELTEPEPRPGGVLDTRIFKPLVAVLAVGWLGSMAYQGARYHRWYAEETDPPGGSPASSPRGDAGEPDTPRRTGIDRLGPFVAGSDLAGWSLVALDTYAEGLRLTAEGPPGRVVFELTCTPSEHTSPFDLGDAHIFHEGPVSYDEIESLGDAIRQEIERATEGRDVCESWRAWAQAAESS
ncbi:MAG: hypothetical protein AAF799_22010 [Myxococcota bacterium]